LDTRSKIVEPGSIRTDGRRLRAVIGYFDPLYSRTVSRLNQLSQAGDALVAIVAEPPAALLPLRARAELVAALASVDFVIAAGAECDRVVSRLPVDEVVDERDADAARASDLVQQVVRRHQTR
jgi:hypothetical protein